MSGDSLRGGGWRDPLSSEDDGSPTRMKDADGSLVAVRVGALAGALAS